MALSQLEQEYYNDLLAPPIDDNPPPADETPTDEAPPVDTPPVDEPPVDTPPVDGVPPVVIPPAVVLPVVDAPPVSTKKYIPIEDEENIYKTLDQKYGYKKMKPEEKALVFIAQQNPGLDDDEIFFIAQSEFGIGVEKPSDDDLTDEQVLSLKKQEIARKKLMYQADQYFIEQAAKAELQGHDPLDLDPDYKAYQNSQVEAQKQEEERKNKYNEILNEIQTTASTLAEHTEKVEVDIDESKLPFDLNFKLDKTKQDKLTDFAQRYSPSDAEVNQFTDPKTGKFDYKGYMTYLIPTVFARELLKTGVKQGITTDREKFIEKELKNSTLRNNDVSKVVDKEFDLVDAWTFGK